MSNIIIVKTSKNVNNGIGFSDVAKNLFPNPSPLLAPFTNPAISTISTVAGINFSGLTIS